MSDISLSREFSEFLPTAESQALEALLTAIEPETIISPVSVWQPHPENKPQCLAYEIAKSGKVNILGYGGEGGGGKTATALGIAGTLFKNSLIFRREYPQLREIIKQGNAMYPSRYVAGDKHSWSFHGRSVTLGHMQRIDDWEKYQGWGNDFVAFDEASQFFEEQVRAMFGWTRTTEEGQHAMVGLFFNPPTNADGRWIKHWFAPWVDPSYKGIRAQPGEVRWFAPDPDNEDTFVEVESGEPVTINGVELLPHSRTFIPASRHDNPYLGEDYERHLNLLPGAIRAAVRDARWDAGEQDDDWQLIPSSWVEEAVARWYARKQPEFITGLGVDVARGGKDRTCAAILRGDYFDEILTLPGESTKTGYQSASIVLKAIGSNRRIPINVDSIGVGAGTFDILRGQGYNAKEVDVRKASYTMDVNQIYYFVNLRAQIAWQLREALHPVTGVGLALPDDPDLIGDLTTPLWKLTPRGIQVEAKEDIYKRLHRSTDKGDAVMLAWYTLQNADEPARPLSEILGGFGE